MSEPHYPSSDLDNSSKLLALLGSHWENVYQGRFTIQSLLFARAQEEKQTLSIAEETERCVSRINIPVHHTDLCSALTLKQSECNTNDTIELRYGDTNVFYDGEYNYGDFRRVEEFTFPVPTALADVNVITDRITNPSVVLIKGIDFTLNTEYGYISFRESPFNNSLLTPTTIYTNGVATDSEIDLFLWNCQIDKQYIQTQFGYLLGLNNLISHEDSKKLINAILDAYVEGTAFKHIQDLLSAVTGIPFVKENDETVELIQNDNKYLIISTDKNLYRFPLNSTSVVNVGDVLSAGDALVSAVRLYDLQQGPLPPSVFAVSIGTGLLSPGYVDALTFVNKTVSVDTTISGGETKVSFELGGFPTDIEKFWDDIHAAGLSTAITLANYMDVRGVNNMPFETTAASLPATINPVEFLIDNLLRHNALICRIETNKLNNAIDLDFIRLMRRIVPPWSVVIIIFEIVGDGDTLDDISVLETPDTYPATDLVGDTITIASVLEAPIARSVGGQCR